MAVVELKAETLLKAMLEFLRTVKRPAGIDLDTWIQVYMDLNQFLVGCVSYKLTSFNGQNLAHCKAPSLYS